MSEVEAITERLCGNRNMSLDEKLAGRRKSNSIKRTLSPRKNFRSWVSWKKFRDVYGYTEDLTFFGLGTNAVQKFNILLKTLAGLELLIIF